MVQRVDSCPADRLARSLPGRDQVEAHAVTKRPAATVSRGPRSTPAEGTTGSQDREINIGCQRVDRRQSGHVRLFCVLFLSAHEFGTQRWAARTREADKQRAGGQC